MWTTLKNILRTTPTSARPALDGGRALRIHVAGPVEKRGGGSHTFAGLFSQFARDGGHEMLASSRGAEILLVIAHNAEASALARAQAAGARIVHRLDEHIEGHEAGPRRDKHEKIRAINRLADLTVYQSRFVESNLQPILQARRYCVIHNGGDPKEFHPTGAPGAFIGHVTWGVGDKKRLDLVRDFIASHPAETFLLAGRHGESGIDFSFPNVTRLGSQDRAAMPALYRKMKLLYFPSENDPCPNTVIEAILSGVPVCYNPVGGTKELVRDCGLPLERADEMLGSLGELRSRCAGREDLHFSSVFRSYIEEMRGLLS